MERQDLSLQIYTHKKKINNFFAMTLQEVSKKLQKRCHDEMVLRPHHHLDQNQNHFILHILYIDMD